MQTDAVRRAVRQRTAATAGVVAATLALAGCAGSDAPPPACPQAVTLADAARVVAFVDGKRDLTDKRYEARILDVASACEIDTADDGSKTVRAEVKIAFQAEKGPANAEGEVPIRYFLAIADSERNILRRRAFGLTVSLPGNTTQGRAVDTLAPTLPLGADANPQGYRFIVGFELDREQLRHNRRNPL